MGSLLSLRRVSKSYWRGARELVVMRDVSLDVDAGKLVAVWGKHRAGKSTLAAVAAGVEAPDSGSVHFAGTELTERRRWFGRLLYDGIAWVQRPAGASGGFDELLEYVMLPLLGQHSPRAARRHASETLRRIGLTECASAPWEALTDAERTLAALARALVRRPRLLVADDPTASLSVLQRAEVMSLLRDVAHDDGAAVLVVLPDMPDVTYADVIACLSDGELLRAPSEVAATRDVVDISSRRPGRGQLGA